MHRCDNCEWKGDTPGRELDDVPNLWERLEVGGTVPSGDCPECGCLVYADAEEKTFLNRALAYPVRDATTLTVRMLTIRTDQHGLVVEVEGSAESVVIDLNGGQLRVWHSDEDGDVTDERPALAITLAAPGDIP